MKALPVKRSDVQPGDWADHKSGRLDPRRVARINTRSVYLDFWGDGVESGPYPAANYAYSRMAEVVPVNF